VTATLPPEVEQLFSERSKRVGPGAFRSPRANSSRILFSSGFPDPSSMPKHDMAEATRVALERDGEWALQYGHSRGYEGLVEALQAKLKRDQGIDATEENLLIVNGAGQGLCLIIEAFCNPGDVILSEEPTWMGAVKHFRGFGVEVETVPVDEHGTNVEALEDAINRLKAEGRKPKVFYMIPNFQNPTGVTTTLERRQRVVELAKEHMIPVIEDDAYSDLRYAGDRLPSLYSLDDSGMVIFLGTFSKIIGAGLRLGWIVAHPRFISAFAALKPEGGTSPFVGAAAAEFCASGTLVEHVNDLRKIYDGRRQAMLAALEEHMPAGTRWTNPEGGFFLWVTLPDGVSASELAPLALEAGVEFSPGPIFHFHGGGEGMIRLSYSFANEEQIETGVATLARLIKEQMSATISG
jgi:2-aminoadipate transaminase